MKKVDDRKIVDTLKKTSFYNIKTTSSSILERYNSKRKSYVESIKKNKKPYIFGGISALAMASVVGIVLGITFSNYEKNIRDINETYEEVFKPIHNEYLAKQLVTFNTFSAIDYSSYKTNELNRGLFLKNKYSVCPDEDNKELLFNNAVDTFDPFSYGAKSIFEMNKIHLLEEVTVFSYQNVDYDIKNSLFIGDKLIGNYYFRSNYIENESHKGLFIDSKDCFFEVHINNECEKDDEEIKEKVISTFISLNGKDKSVVKIKKETEFEGAESENSYSFTYFENKESHRSNSPLYTLEYEVEKDNEDLVAEISYKKKGEKSIFTDIEMINENELQFLPERVMDCEGFEDFIQVKFLEDNRIYSSNEFNTLK